MQFAEMLDCQRNTVSRYELGAFPPGPLVLIRLFQIAESAGLLTQEDRVVIIRELKAQHVPGDERRTVEEMIAAMRPLLAEMHKEGRILDAVSERQKEDYRFRQF